MFSRLKVAYAELKPRHWYLRWMSSTANLKETQPVSMAGQQQPIFGRTSIGTFFQEEPCFGNQYIEDSLLRSYLKRQLPPEVFLKVDCDLERFGARLCDEIDDLGKECNVNHPVLQHYDAWGRRVDRIVTCPAWKKMKKIAAEEGLVAEAYDRKYSNWSRLYQVAKLYLYAPSAGLFTCPLAMTDGAAKVIETLGISGPLEKAYSHLTSRDPKIFWTSGQWMTERKGGSDVAGGTETVAREQPDGSYRLYGFKWFTSATDADMTLTLGRVMDAQGNTVEGSKGLSLFYLEMFTEDGRLNNIEVQRLKDKLGTRQVPTAELLLDGTKAFKISDEGRGVASIANMLTITRVHNSISAASAMKRIVTLAREYASKRFVFGKFIQDHPLHMQTMARMEVETRGAFLLLMEVARLLGLEENHMGSEIDLHLLRLLTPIVKLYTGKQAIAVVSEGLECFGGQGYMEDTGLPGMLRDAQVLSIWEGTTNILSLDVLRAITKTRGQVLAVFSYAVKSKLEAAADIPELKQAVKAEQIALGRLEEFIHKAGTQEASFLEVAARDLSYSLARIYAGALLVEHASWKEATSLDIYAAVRWCEQELCPVATAEKAGNYSAEMVAMDTALVYDGSSSIKGKL
ncbi:acyl-CoA dehydrogenase family member 11-like [Protopterus annectens]|uniref:acyl-CoA dehydrogenase family member 11-like n=1 Tax=Protopterus annectens TaxID=7888 RepID=UPI001CF9960F|nr:acyl-CoA dehydrogenase family member 11-like [Protopterus annectens]